MLLLAGSISPLKDNTSALASAGIKAGGQEQAATGATGATGGRSDPGPLGIRGGPAERSGVRFHARAAIKEQKKKREEIQTDWVNADVTRLDGLFFGACAATSELSAALCQANPPRPGPRWREHITAR